MTVLFAVLLFIGVGVLAVIHAMWGLGYNWPEATEEALAKTSLDEVGTATPLLDWCSLRHETQYTRLFRS